MAQGSHARTAQKISEDGEIRCLVSNQMLVVDEVHRTSCLHLAFKWEQGDFKPINLWTKGPIWTTVMSEQDEMLRV